MEYLLGIDLGTSYLKFSLVGRDGHLHGLARLSAPTSAPRPGRQEIDPTAFWRVVREGIALVAGKASILPREIRGVSYSSQANSFILLDRRGDPLTPIVLWSDERADSPSPDLRELWERDDYLATTGIAIRGLGLAAAKIDWFRREEPDVLRKTARALSLSDYLTCCLTGEAAGDESTGGLLGLWDLRHHRWWTAGLSAVGLQENQLAHLLPPATRVGTTKGQKAEELGLPGTALFSAGSLDHYAAGVGSGLGFHGDTSESTGTVLACLELHTDWHPDPAYCTGPAAEEGRWYRLAFGPNGARGLEWLRDRLPERHSVEELALLAGEVPPGAGGLYAPPSAHTRRDLACFVHDGPAATAHPPGEYARAVMESSARSLAALLRNVDGDRMPPNLLATGGGARSDAWLQIKADLLGVEIHAAAQAEAAAVGAALFASVGAGWYATLRQAVGSFVSIERRFFPRPAVHDFYLAWSERYRRLFAAAPDA